MPREESLPYVGLGLYPPFVDGVGETVGIDGCAGCLGVGVVTVEAAMLRRCLGGKGDREDA